MRGSRGVGGWVAPVVGLAIAVAAGLAVTLSVAVAVALAAPTPVAAQADTTIAQEGLYDRPFLTSVGGTSIGGYLEGNTNYFREEGVSEGFSMELRRFNVFLFSAIGPRVRFLSELEFEHGTEEIALETAQIDVRFSSAFVLRAGIILPPLGYLNQNHDSPRWDFVERPFVSTDLIPSTLSEVGGGVYGKLFRGPYTFSYDAYVTNGLQDGVIDNTIGRTDIASGKSEEAFGEDNNGSPALSGRVGLHHREWGEVGVSYYGGNYNSFRIEGEEVDERRWLGIAAFDFGATVGPVSVRGEVAHASIDVPAGMSELFGDGQWAGHVDLTTPLWRPPFFEYESAVVWGGLRLEHIDYNTGTFSSTGRRIYDEVRAIVPTVSFRPSPGTVFRLNYRFHWTRDFAGNPTSRSAGIQFGFATYF